MMSKLLEKASDGGVDTEKQDQMYLVPCKQGRQRLPTLELLIQDHWVQMRPEDYLVTSLNDFRMCMIGLIPSITDFFVFGDTLMRGFYTIHSDE